MCFLFFYSNGGNVQRLGAFGPLKCRERQALAKLQVQGRILNKLSKLIEKWQNDPSYNFSALAELNGLPHLQVTEWKLQPQSSVGGLRSRRRQTRYNVILFFYSLVWTTAQKLWGIVCSGSSHALCVSCEDVMTRLLPLTRSSLNFVSDDMQRKGRSRRSILLFVTTLIRFLCRLIFTLIYSSPAADSTLSRFSWLQPVVALDRLPIPIFCPIEGA